MKLMCISILPQIYNQTNIEVGRVYDIHVYVNDDRWYARDKRMISIILDDGTHQEYPKACFVTLEEFRNNKINDILNDKD